MCYYVQVVVVIGISFASKCNVRINFIDEKVLHVKHIGRHIIQG